MWALQIIWKHGSVRWGFNPRNQIKMIDMVRLCIWQCYEDCIPFSIRACRCKHITQPQTHTCISVTLESSWCFKCTQSESPDSHYGCCLVFLSLCLPCVLYVMPGNFQRLRGKLFWVVVSGKALLKWNYTGLLWEMTVVLLITVLPIRLDV